MILPLHPFLIFPFCEVPRPGSTGRRDESREAAFMRNKCPPKTVSPMRSATCANLGVGGSGGYNQHLNCGRVVR